jgi:hypothetical protein
MFLWRSRVPSLEDSHHVPRNSNYPVRANERRPRARVQCVQAGVQRMLASVHCVLASVDRAREGIDRWQGDGARGARMSSGRWCLSMTRWTGLKRLGPEAALSRPVPLTCWRGPIVCKPLSLWPMGWVRRPVRLADRCHPRSIRQLRLMRVRGPLSMPSRDRGRLHARDCR